MKGWIRRTCAGCVVALALGVPLAHASSSGTITFVGAIVAPTCSIGEIQATPGQTAGGCGEATGGQAAHLSMYRQDVVSLESTLSSQDRLLNYFADYAGTADTRLLTRTYE